MTGFYAIITHLQQLFIPTQAQLHHTIRASMARPKPLHAKMHISDTVIAKYGTRKFRSMRYPRNAHGRDPECTARDIRAACDILAMLTNWIPH